MRAVNCSPVGRKINIVTPAILGIVVVATALILAPGAHADPPYDPQADYDYIQELYAFGITRQTLDLSPGAFLDVGNTICTGLGRGRDPNAMVSGIQTAWPNLTQKQSQMLISVSVGNFCPSALPTPLPWSPQH